jgi:hypothetical protein
LKLAFGSVLTAVATKIVSPQTIGLEWPRPGIGHVPQDVRAGLAIPGVGEILSVCHAGCGGAAKRRPTAGGR